MRGVALIAALAAAALAAPAGAEGRRGAGTATFRHGARAYRLPLETIDVEEVRGAGRTDVHVSLVFRDARNRLLSLAFVHRGPGRVLAAGSIDLTASTPSGLSRYDARRSRCELELTAARPGALEGKGRCRGLFDFGGERRAPDVTELRFTAGEAPGPAPPATNPASRNPG